MSEHTIYPSKQALAHTPAPQCLRQTEAANDFAALLRADLGEAGWQALAPAIRTRFRCYGARPIVFRGCMQWVYCSPLGALIARLLKPFSILPQRCARDSGFEFIISLCNGVIHKQRNYFFNGQGKPFVFSSLFDAKPDLHELFGGGIGMRLKLASRRGALLFRDKGYFLRLGPLRLPLPSILSVGRFDLLHRNLDENRFQIIIRLSHPLLGTLFYQRGEFERFEG